MGFKDEFVIKQIPYKEAINIVIKHHYLHRRCPVSIAFGLFKINNVECLGVITYGVSASSTLLKGICGQEEAKNVYELNRLWVDDSVSKNGESFLVGNTIKLLDKEIIVSFADTSRGHLGIIYQASNFIYTGLSRKFKDPVVMGKENEHHATFGHGLTNKQIIEKYGAENVKFVERSRKHRYIFFNCNSKRKSMLLKKLRYPILPYPKNTKAEQV